MKKVFLSALIVPLLFSCKSAGVKHDTVKNDLRAPAYPLITIDPYTSAWSAVDNLYDAGVTHWTGKDFPFIGVIKVDGVPYRFMGVETLELKTVVPTSLEADWSGNYTTVMPQGDWTAESYNDSNWKTDKGAFGTMDSEPLAKTQWGTKNIWVRRAVDINEDLGNKPVYLQFSHDDDAIFYINGVKAFSTGTCYGKDKVAEISPEARAALKQGTNIIAAECVNPQYGGFLDFGLAVPSSDRDYFEKTAIQTSVDVQATQTHYTFECGPVDMRLTFTAPLLMDNLDLISRPVNYVTYVVDSNDGKKHNVELYFEASPLWALNTPSQQSVSEAYEKDGLVYLRTGSRAQEVLAKRGDDLRIDWGYFYMVAPSSVATYGVGSSQVLRENFVDGKSVAVATKGENADGKLAIVCNYGEVSDVTGKVMIGYDDQFSIQYFGTNLRPYWNKNGDKTIESQFEAANNEYDALMAQCYAFDKKLMEDAMAAGGKEYAELCALAYRQSISAHKLVESPKGQLLWLSKENNSNGSIGTVDVTYPSAPLFLYYNPELAKGLLNHIFEYAEYGDWNKPFPAHDVGTYPQANGQTYGGDMPVEESGNMIILTAAICDAEGSPEYAKKHWDALTTWTDYLVEYGLDPENQLCTDDFAGHFAHNANLSIKAILGIASYAKMAQMQGLNDVADKYFAIARDYAGKWEQMANDGDHYKLTFDKPGTWSQKYNIVWDDLLNLGIFSEKIAPTEIDYYLTIQNEYGLPLDNRRTYTKSDWIVWTATLADSPEKFEAFIKPMHKFYGETVNRVPMSDWYFTDKPNYQGFIARSVVGGYFMKMLAERAKNQN